MLISGHPQKVGRYSIQGILGRGGMGNVYRAAETSTGKVVALKVLNPSEPLVELLGLNKLHDIFADEARKMAILEHPNIIRALDMDSENGLLFFTMEYLCNNIGMMIGERFTLEDSTRIIRPDKVMDYGSQVLEGLKAIHAAGMIHRDIKPQNILVTDQDEVKICDFGMARQLGNKSFEAKGMKVGSPHYSSPEQSRNPDAADQRSDLYSTAVMLYRMLTGELPGMKSFLLSRVNPLFDRDWDNFFTTALDWNPKKRFQEAGEMAEALLRLEIYWEKRLARACRIQYEGSVAAALQKKLRKSPVRASGSDAKQKFEVNELWQPVDYIENIFAGTRDDTFYDKATGLIWQPIVTDYPVDREEADEIISGLNASSFAETSSWRLPTVNELLSLVNDPTIIPRECDTNIFQDHRHWFWSCDRRSEKTSWYVNTSLGYTGWQENGCRYYVLPVASV